MTSSAVVDRNGAGNCQAHSRSGGGGGKAHIIFNRRVECMSIFHKFYFRFRSLLPADRAKRAKRGGGGWGKLSVGHGRRTRAEIKCLV